ncbi:MAG TPA: TIGR03086 family metal-binding protein [Streptosporangiaceae bacterium]|nr:TIGR03086 family metal-binding protein [Streptosporangiaceae bacterium]
MTFGDIRDLDRRAVRVSVEVVAKVTAEDLGRSTPCSEWTVGDLLAHMTVQHDGFAAAAAGGGGDLAIWQVRPLAADPVAEYSAAAERVIAAFAEVGVLSRSFLLPEIIPGAEFPAAQAISFHFIDYVVHAWDVARSLGVPYAPGEDLIEAALPVAAAVPEGKHRLEPGAAFRPGVLAPAEASTLDRILAMLGRSPTWSAAG